MDIDKKAEAQPHLANLLKAQSSEIFRTGEVYFFIKGSFVFLR